MRERNPSYSFLFNRELTPLKEKKNVTRSKYSSGTTWNEVRCVDLVLPVDGQEATPKKDSSSSCERLKLEQRSTHLGANYYQEAERLKGIEKKLHELRIHNLPP